uniref:Uncharacterized protein n=1 Tax=Octopus bimaculoides TaxID=37653 RepID=A0A0L8H667_OCTBM
MEGTLNENLESEEKWLMSMAADKQAWKKEHSNSNKPKTVCKCALCDRDCHSCINLFSHQRYCFS